MYDATLMDELLATVKHHKIICIADEVMTGFGRTGKLFASEYLAHKPDIICLSKGLTGGTMALGVTACTDTIYQAFVNDDKLKTFFHGHSFTANPLACTTALASLHLLAQNNCLKTVQWITEQNQLFAAKLITNYAAHTIKNVRVLGTILAFEIVSGKDEYLNNIATIITQQAMAAGVYIRPLGNTVYIMPPYCITAEELQKVYEVLENIVTASAVA
jgi:adenosylmethionine-8-amino-7-oxononanoate aminotransferase